MKRAFLLVFSIFLLLSFAACGTQPIETPHEDAPSADSNAATETTPEAASDNDSAHTVLVVYFSATGNTEKIAETIAETTGGDLFELVPETPYDTADLDWTDENSRVVYEHEHPEARDIALTASTVADFDRYNTVFIGYPIWWGIAAWPIDGFVRANDFTDKTVIPFCTSSSSDIGESDNLLKELAGSGNWLKGKRFSSAASKNEITDWLAELGL